jgi:hypothetical protein
VLVVAERELASHVTGGCPFSNWDRIVLVKQLGMDRVPPPPVPLSL